MVIHSERSCSWRLNDSKKDECAGYNRNFIEQCFQAVWNILVKYDGILNLAPYHPLWKPNIFHTGRNSV